MKYIIMILTIISLGSVFTGLILDLEYSQKLIGGGAVLLFFVVFPLFIWYRWKDKNFKDYMLTKENLDKMKDNSDF